jgi:hypothetical protein
MSKRRQVRVSEETRKECLAGSEFPQGTSFYLLRLLVTERKAKGAKAFHR